MLLEESALLCSPIIFSIVKPDPLDDRILDFVIGINEEVTRFGDKSGGLYEVKADESGGEMELPVFGGDSPMTSKGDLAGESRLGELVIGEEAFNGNVTGGNPTGHGGGGGLIGKFANCAARAAAAIIGCGGIIWLCGDKFRLIGKLL